jgi:hypothetical protein
LGKHNALRESWKEITFLDAYINKEKIGPGLLRVYCETSQMDHLSYAVDPFFEIYPTCLAKEVSKEIGCAW